MVLQLRLRLLSVIFFVLCLCIYTFVGLRTCSSFILSFLGYLPMQMVSKKERALTWWWCFCWHVEAAALPWPTELLPVLAGTQLVPATLAIVCDRYCMVATCTAWACRLCR